MSFLRSVLESELRTIGVEARKKEPRVQEAAERALQRLQELVRLQGTVERSGKWFVLEATKTDELLLPFELCCTSAARLAVDSNGSGLSSSGNSTSGINSNHSFCTRLASMGLNGLQKLVSHRAVREDQLPRVLAAMASVQAANDNENVQLKVLQTTVALLTLASSDRVVDVALPQAMGMCFQLHQSRSPMVHHPASATLRQVIGILFEQAAKEVEDRKRERAQVEKLGGPIQVGSSQGISSLESQTMKNEANGKAKVHTGDYVHVASQLLQDLCLLAGGDRALWLPVTHVDELFALELVESIVHAHYRLFLSSRPFRKLLKDFVCPLVVKHVRTATSFPHVMRVNRLLGVFVRHFHHVLVAECEVFLSRMIKQLQDNALPQWQHTLVLEVLHDFCGDASLTRSIFESYDLTGERAKASVHIFQGLVSAVGQLVQRAFSWPDAEVRWMGGGGRARLLDMLTLHATAPPKIVRAYVVTLSAECMAGLAAAITHCIPAADRLPINRDQANQQRQDRENSGLTQVPADYDLFVARAMATASWPSLLPALAVLLRKCLDEDLLHSLLGTCQVLIHAFGVLGLVTPRDTLLATICREATDARETSHQSKSNAHTKLKNKAYPSSPAASVESPTGMKSFSPSSNIGGKNHHGGNDKKSQGTTSTTTTTTTTTPSRGLSLFPASTAVMASFLPAMLGGSSSSSSNQSNHSSSGSLSSSDSEKSSESSFEGKKGSKKSQNFESASSSLGDGRANSHHHHHHHHHQKLLPEGKIFTHKSAQCMQTLLNVAHSMGGVLALNSWELLFRCFWRLDELLKRHAVGVVADAANETLHSTSASVLPSPAAPASEAERKLLRSALDSLAVSSRYLDHDHVRFLLGALAKLATEALKPSSRALSVRLFPLQRLVETAQLNAQRAQQIWAAVVPQLAELATHEEQPVREIAVTSLTELICTAFEDFSGHTDHHHQQEEDGDEDEEERVSTTPSWNGKEKEGSSLSTGGKDHSATFHRDALDARGQLRLVRALRVLCSAPYDTVRCAALDTIGAILRSSGSSLASEAWVPLLGALEEMAKRDERRDTMKASDAFELIITDFLGQLSAHSLAAAIQVAFALASQRNHLNTALTAVQDLLPPIADYIVMHRDRLNQSSADLCLPENASLEEVSSGPSMTNHNAPPPSLLTSQDRPLSMLSSPLHLPLTYRALTPDAQGGFVVSRPTQLMTNTAASATTPSTHTTHAMASTVGKSQSLRFGSRELLLSDRLLLCVFRRLEEICIDDRAEVRNGALDRLFAGLAQHGDVLHRRTWETLAEDILFPVLERILQRADEASAVVENRSLRESAHGTGQDGTGSSKEAAAAGAMLVHHSRDSPQKQWHESIVLASRGVAKVLRVFARTLSTVRSFGEVGWSRYLKICESLASHKSREVCEAGIQNLVKVLVEYASQPDFGEKSWHQAWVVMESLALLALKSSWPQNVLECYAGSLLELIGRCRERFQNKFVLRLLGILACLGSVEYPYCFGVELPSLHRIVLEAIGFLSSQKESSKVPTITSHKEKATAHPVQRASLSLMLTFVSVPLWIQEKGPASRAHLLKEFMVPDHLRKHCFMTANPTHEVPPSSRARAHPSSLLLAHHAAKSIVSCLVGPSISIAREQEAIKMASRCITGLLKSQLRLGALATSAQQFRLWQNSLENLFELVLYSLPEIFDQCSKDQQHSVWINIFEDIQSLIKVDMKKSFSSSSSTFSQRKPLNGPQDSRKEGNEDMLEEPWDIRLLDLMCGPPLVQYALSNDIRWGKVTKLLQEGITHWSTTKDHFAKACYVRLFVLCSQPVHEENSKIQGKEEETGGSVSASLSSWWNGPNVSEKSFQSGSRSDRISQVVKIVIQRCENILEKYQKRSSSLEALSSLQSQDNPLVVVKDAKEKDAHLEKANMPSEITLVQYAAELNFLLPQLLSLRIDPQLPLGSKNIPSKTNCAHIFVLAPALANAVRIEDVKIRNHVALLLELMANEILS